MTRHDLVDALHRARHVEVARIELRSVEAAGRLEPQRPIEKGPTR
jgi:hypothetical protein